MGFWFSASWLLLVLVLQRLFVPNLASNGLKPHGSWTNDEFVSAIGDPGMRNVNVRVALEAWNFCNEVGFEAPGMGSPRLADCANFYCPSISTDSLDHSDLGNVLKCGLLHKVSEPDNCLKSGDKFPVADFKSYTDPDLFAVEKELYLASLCEMQQKGLMVVTTIMAVAS
ncbi:hypothetical protein Patl1_07605 [Pistacia atlantica]|uniref:Uncharacterized protein n=1 Tax=Pistacia atlantica TaxID=434234 RepID=A0ACC1AEA4_9ROSI|nr:hypothetical protein Patl1_07605 [Pistacia atlantica]